jgi:GNAT superfamily N-acetyltransferase
MARISPHGAIHEEDGLILVATGRALPFFNAAAVTRVAGDPAEALARTRAFFKQHGLRFMLSATGTAAEAMAPVMDAAGPRFEPSNRMLLAPPAGEPRPVPGLEVRPVEDLEALRDYVETMTAGFEGDLPWAAPEMLQDDRLLRVPDLTHYLGFMDGRPVATAMRFTIQRVAHIANVSTIPAYRRRGIGEAITWRTVLDGRAEGCLAAYLQASEMGFPIYQRMGFRHVVTHQMWLSP